MNDQRQQGGSRPGRISLVVSDVDGTIVTSEKTILASTITAAASLREAGIRLAVVSARPPRGIEMVVDALGLDIYAGFNGGTIVDRKSGETKRTLVSPEAARIAIAGLEKAGADIWVFSGDQWLVLDRAGAYVERERRTIQFEPVVVSSFDDHLGAVGKIVGSSRDFAMLAQAETDLSLALGAMASAHRSQPYYLDVTPAGTDKGFATAAFASHWGVPLNEVAVLGDMANDVPMFKVAGLSIAMGNAPAAVQAAADHVTGSHDADGWAQAVRDLILKI